MPTASGKRHELAKRGEIVKMLQGQIAGEIGSGRKDHYRSDGHQDNNNAGDDAVRFFYIYKIVRQLLCLKTNDIIYSASEGFSQQNFLCLYGICVIKYRTK